MSRVDVILMLLLKEGLSDIFLSINCMYEELIFLGVVLVVNYDK